MSRPTSRSIMRVSIAVAACLAILAVIQRIQDSSSSAATPGLSTSATGAAFAPGDRDDAPVMNVRGLRQGDAVSGTVTVRNPGPGSRYFWLTPGRMAERLGATGGRLSSALMLTVLDVTDVASPAVIYRGSVGGLGATPLGFLAPGARRSFSFVAQLPTGGRSPVTPSVDPYRGATAAVSWNWRSMPGRPAGAAPARVQRPRDRRAPQLAYVVPRRQQLLQQHALRMTVRCDEDCTLRGNATMRSRGRSWTLATRAPARGTSRSHAVSVRFAPAQLAALRSAMVGGRATRVRLSVAAYDRSGNRRRGGHSVTLRARR